MSVLPTHVRTKECVKIWTVGTSAPALTASLVTAVRLMLMIATAPPVWMEEHVWMLSMISGQWRGIRCTHLNNVFNTLDLNSSMVLHQVWVCQRLQWQAVPGGFRWLRTKFVSEWCNLCGRCGHFYLQMPSWVQRNQVWDRYRWHSSQRERSFIMEYH